MVAVLFNFCVAGEFQPPGVGFPVFIGLGPIGGRVVIFIAFFVEYVTGRRRAGFVMLASGFDVDE